MQIDLPRGYFIKRVDAYNFAFCKMKEVKRSNGQVVSRTNEIAYSATIPAAIKIAVDRIPFEAKDVPDVVRILRQIEKTIKTLDNASIDHLL